LRRGGGRAGGRRPSLRSDAGFFFLTPGGGGSRDPLARPPLKKKAGPSAAHRLRLHHHGRDRTVGVLRSSVFFLLPDHPRPSYAAPSHHLYIAVPLSANQNKTYHNLPLHCVRVCFGGWLSDSGAINIIRDHTLHHLRSG